MALEGSCGWSLAKDGAETQLEVVWGHVSKVLTHFRHDVLREDESHVRHRHVCRRRGCQREISGCGDRSLILKENGVAARKSVATCSSRFAEAE